MLLELLVLMRMKLAILVACAFSLDSSRLAVLADPPVPPKPKLATHECSSSAVPNASSSSSSVTQARVNGFTSGADRGGIDFETMDIA